MCETCLNKEVCKYREQIETIENYIKTIDNETPVDIDIKCNLKRGDRNA